MKTIKRVLPLMLMLGMVNVSGAADFKPPLRGAPDVRIGGGSRAVTMQLAKINLLAPKTAGVSSTESPVLYWHLSKTVAAMVEVKLLAAGVDKPVFSLSTSGMGVGLHKLNLAEYGVKLQAGGQYTWQTTLVWDAAQRSKDAVSSAAIQYLPLATDAREQIRSADAAVRVNKWLEKGYAYDAIADLSAQMEASPDNASLREARAALLEQLGQVDAAKLDRSK
jgi:hypothetical protein